MDASHTWKSSKKRSPERIDDIHVGRQTSFGFAARQVATLLKSLDHFSIVLVRSP